MGTPVEMIEDPRAAAAELGGGGIRYVTRQPILDLRNKVHAYQLRFSDGPETVLRADRESAARAMIDNTVLFGLGKLTSGMPAFVPCTAETLTGALVEVLPSGMTVLELEDAAEATPELVATCRNLKAAGYRLALDHFTWKKGMEPLLEATAYVKVDFAATEGLQRRMALRWLEGTPITLVAEQVQTQDQFREACNEGFSLVQGFYFCRPVLLENRKVPANRIAQIEILRALHDESLNLHKLTQLVKRDMSLTYRILRMINSPICAMRQEVHSVQAALLAVGEETFRRMATVAITSEMNAGQTSELLRMAFVRGRFCELAARYCAMDCTEQYLLGLMSLLPAMLRAPMCELAPLLPLREEIRRALAGEALAERRLLSWLERYEQADWEACDARVNELGLEPITLTGCYQEAISWAETALYFS
jgi:c-di-GMP phosphodiesterase